MSNYTKLTDFASKDSLPTGTPAKIVKGTEIDDEFQAIETAITSKANNDSPTLSGSPTAPTASAGTNSTQIATTAFVTGAVAGATNSATSNIVCNSVTTGLWKLEDNGSTTVNIYYNGAKVFALDSSGNLTVTGNITAYGTV